MLIPRIRHDPNRVVSLARRCESKQPHICTPLVRAVLAGTLFAPLRDVAGNVGDLHAGRERQPGARDVLVVGRRDPLRVRAAQSQLEGSS